MGRKSDDTFHALGGAQCSREPGPEVADHVTFARTARVKITRTPPDGVWEGDVTPPGASGGDVTPPGGVWGADVTPPGGAWGDDVTPPGASGGDVTPPGGAWDGDVTPPGGAWGGDVTPPGVSDATRVSRKATLERTRKRRVS